ncbi:1384_t:CDS:1, partial [Cetraspora pellucida]
MSNAELVREKNEILLEDLKRVENIRKENMSYEEIIMNAGTKAPLSWHQTPNGFEKIRKDMKYFRKLKRGGRFWRPVVFYLYGPGGSRKSGLVTELFGNELFDKQEKMRSGSSWWNGYEGQDILFLDEFYTKIDWNTMVNLLNDSNHKVQ